jgi:hypothetical protein
LSRQQAIELRPSARRLSLVDGRSDRPVDDPRFLVEGCASKGGRILCLRIGFAGEDGNRQRRESENAHRLGSYHRGSIRVKELTPREAGLSVALSFREALMSKYWAAPFAVLLTWSCAAPEPSSSGEVKDAPAPATPRSRST